MTEATGEREATGSSRRRFLKWLIRLGAGAFAVAFLLPALALQSLTRNRTAVATGDVLVFAMGDQAGMPIRADALQPGQAVQAFPEGKEEDQNNLIELIQLAPGAEGLVAYSAICTHLGCSVLPDLTADGYIACPCHASLFAPAEGAQPISGPANRPLPALPIKVDPQGVVVAAGAFTGPVGAV